MAESWVHQFKGQRITVLSTGGTREERADTGVLNEIGDGWIQLAKDNGDMLLIPYTSIRVVKLLDLAQTSPTLGSETGLPIDSHIYERNAQTI